MESDSDDSFDNSVIDPANIKNTESDIHDSFDNSYFDPTNIEDYQAAVKDNAIMKKVDHPWQKLFKKTVKEIRNKKIPTRQYYAYRFPINTKMITPKLQKRSRPVPAPSKKLCAKELFQTEVTGSVINDILNFLNEEKIESSTGNVIVEDTLSSDKFRTPPNDAGTQRHTDHDESDSNKCFYQMVHDDIREAETSFNSEGSIEIDLVGRIELSTSYDSDGESDYSNSDRNVPETSNSEVIKVSPYADIPKGPRYAPRKPGRRALLKFYSSNDSSLEELLRVTPKVARRISFTETPKTPMSLILRPETSMYAPQKNRTRPRMYRSP